MNSGTPSKRLTINIVKWGYACLLCPIPGSMSKWGPQLHVLTNDVRMKHIEHNDHGLKIKP